MKILNNKDSFTVLKEFRNVYTQINKADIVILKGEKDELKFYVGKSFSPFYFIYGKIKTKNKEILDFFNGKIRKISVADYKILFKLLKKDMKEIRIDDKFTFVINYAESEKEISFDELSEDELEFVEKIENIEKLDFSMIQISEKNFENEKFLIIDNGRKLIETTPKRVYVCSKATDYKLYFSEKFKNNEKDIPTQYVIIYSENEFIKMKNLFRTI